MPKPYFYNKNQVIDEILRVNHAGEYGAVRIYKGQLSSSSNMTINHMLEQEKLHLAYFESQIQSHKSRPTIFLPLWHVGGYLMGQISSIIGPKTAMLCTEAVEEVIDEHYMSQKQVLHDIGEKNLAATIEEFRLEELEHRNIALEHGSMDAPVYGLVKAMISKVCKVAIWISKAV
jgi:ubiquinone biosynthesis monooxygenase Coq7